MPGYGEELFQDAAAAAKCLCPICRGVWYQAAKCTSCRHVFCRTCIDKWTRVSKACPLCRTDIKDIEDFDAPLLTMYCFNRQLGCDVVVNVNTARDHDCSYRQERMRRILETLPLPRSTKRLMNAQKIYRDMKYWNNKCWPSKRFFLEPQI
jgi:hypothetical protein